MHTLQSFSRTQTCYWTFSSQKTACKKKVRSGLYAKRGPALGRRRKSENMYTPAIYMRQKSTNKSRCEFHRVLSNAAFLQCPGFSYRQYASSFESQVFRGRPTRRVPQGCQESKRWTHRCAGKLATCFAQFQYFLQVMQDHVLTRAFATKLLVGSFHRWRISFQAAFQPTSDGGPTMDLQNFRKWTSKVASCEL